MAALINPLLGNNGSILSFWQNNDFIVMTFVAVLFFVLSWHFYRQLQKIKKQLVNNQTNSKYYLSQTEDYKNYVKYLHMIADSQRDELIVLDHQGCYKFFNKQTMLSANSNHQEIYGKTLAQVIGPVKARLFQSINLSALRSDQPISKIHKFEEDGQIKTILSHHIPLPEGEILMTFHDLSQTEEIRDRHEKILYAIVQTLVSLLAARDPYAARHAQRVAEVTKAIAEEMGVDNETKKTAILAADLIGMNHLLIPDDLLVKDRDLTPQEKDLVQKSILKSTEILSHITFGIPIVETLRQRQEKWDGTGYPGHLSGETILLSARIVAVANAFVAMVSPRSYRKAKSFGEALNTIMLGAERHYDPKVVAALMHHVNNKDGFHKWEHFSQYEEPLLTQVQTGLKPKQNGQIPHHLSFGIEHKSTSSLPKRPPHTKPLFGNA